MSSPFRASLLTIGVAALALAACDREERHSGAKPIGETVPAGQSPDTIWAGGQQEPAPDPRAKLYDNNAQAIAQGQTLYMQMNCVGCHFHGGGGMGPALMDDEWRYGGRIDQIASTIAEGRPNGMPAWRNKIPDEQVWELVAYVQSMSGNEPIDVLPGRSDHLRYSTPENARRAQTPVQTHTP